MISAITGQFICYDEKGCTVEIDTAGGIRYEIHVASSFGEKLKKKKRRTDEDRIEIINIHHHQREDGDKLYGFGSHMERDIFRTLIGIKQVGPSLAMKLFNYYNWNALIGVLKKGDPVAFMLIPGVGDKVATRLIEGWKNAQS